MMHQKERQTMQNSPWEFIQTLQTLSIASSNHDHSPHISYAPFIEYDKAFYICISGMAAHTKNLLQHDTASIMISEDESQSTNLFAKKRVSFDVEVLPIARDSEAFEKAMVHFFDKFSDQANIYAQMADFQLFRLTPKSGRAVFGFGKAYDFKNGEFSDKPMGMMR